MSASVIAFELLDRIAGESNFLWQYDYGQKMRLTGVELPMSYTVHFSNSSRGASIPSIGDASGVSIPDQVLLTGKPVYFWLFLHVGETDGQTAYANIINVHPRANLPEIDPPSPEQQSILDELIAALNAGILHVDEIAEGIPQVVDNEIAAAKERGEFKGDPGAVFTPSIADGVMTWSNDGDLPNPEPTDFNTELGLANFATKQELNSGLGSKVDNGKIGQPNGVAALDETGHVPSELLPSYVDDIVEYPSVSQFPSVGESGKIYISTSNNHWYRWTGSQYFDMTSADISLKADKRDTILETTLSRGRKAGSNVGTASVAFGDNVEASGVYSQAFGQNTVASGGVAYAEGCGTGAFGNISHAEGYNTRATGLDSHAEGCFAQATADYAHAEGYYSVASDNSSHAEGSLTTASGLHSHAEGHSTQASGDVSHAEGLGGTFMIGGQSYRSGALGDYAHSEGNITSASGDGAHSEGMNTVASGDKSHAEGTSTIASNDAAHAEGANTTASGQYSHSEGASTIASGSCSHSEGGGTSATGQCAHSEGGGTQATGNNSHAEGSSSQATGAQSHAEGGNTHATGSSSHSEGAGTTASGDYSHAEGGGTHATASYSHAEGGGSQATGANAHAEGSGTIASGSGSHSEGGATIASGPQSHAEGGSTIAAGAFSHASGMYNVEDTYDNTNWPEWIPGEHCVPGDKRKRTRIIDEETVIEGFICETENTDSDWDITHWENQNGKMNYAVVVGNGTSVNNRSNAYCLDWDGNGHFAGDVYIGCNPNGTGGTKLELVPFATDAETMSIFESA